MTIQSEQKSMISTRIDEDTEDTEDEGEEDEGREEEEEGEEGDSREAKEIGSGDTIFRTKDPEKSASIGKLHECYCNYKINIFDETIPILLIFRHSRLRTTARRRTQIYYDQGTRLHPRTTLSFVD